MTSSPAARAHASLLIRLAVAATSTLAAPVLSAQELGIPQASGASTGTQQATAAPGTGPVWVMPALSAGMANALSVLSSDDGVTFVSHASETFTPPAGALRDPSIARHGDGWYYLVYTNGAREPGFGLARSKNLRRWEFVRDVRLSGSATAASAPEWLRERDGTLKVVLTLTTAAGQGAHVLTPGAGFAQWSAPVALRGLDAAHADAFVAVDGAGYVAAARNLRSGAIEVARAASLAGPWTVTPLGDWAGQAGAPALARLADGRWRLYAGGANGTRGWYADSTDALRSWQPKQPLAGSAAMAGAFSVVVDERKDFTAASAPQGRPKKVEWDAQSLKIDGKRVVVWSGEMHPFRMPNPSLWRDVIQKMKALGFNGIAYYFDWGYHSPAPGVYDFSGIRNVERALEMAEEEGMYIIARTGPYINSELSGGGYPGWMFRSRAEARTDDPVYLAAVDEWMTQVNAIIARHQVTTGGGNVIAYQIENELMKVEPKHVRQMAHLAKKARQDGISVPFFHNAAGRLPDWTPPGSSAPWANPGPTDLYAFDGYPGGSCDVHASPAGPNKAPDWGIYGLGGPKTGALSSPGTPGFAAELGGGWFDYWGSNGTYGCTAERQGAGYQRVFYGTNLINRLTIHNIYMVFGGTSWGWLPGPVVYTSYDYGAAISEDRGLRRKAYALKQQGMFVGAAEAVLAEMDKGPPLTPSSNKVKVYHNVNKRLGTHVLFAVHSPSDGLSDDRFTVDLSTRDGAYTLPLRLKGQDGKMLLASYALERQHLVYSTSELQTHFANGERDVALLHGRGGEEGETVLRFASAPRVEVLAGQVTSSWDAVRGDLKLSYLHDGLARVRISGGGRAPLLLLLADEENSLRFWAQDTPRGKVLQQSAALVRSSTFTGTTLALQGDTQETTDLQIWGPAFSAASFNGAELALTAQPDGSVRTAPVKGPDAVKLPDLGKLAWTRRMDSLEAQPAFDDSSWVRADKRASAAQTWTMPERGQPTLAMSDYGFHHGDVWYRGHVDIKEGKTNQLELFYGAGGAGMIQVWIDGRYVGQHELDVGRSFPETTDSVKFALGALTPGKHVIAVMVRNNSHNWNLMADDFHREARGLISASLTSRGGKRFAVPIDWRLQGRQGGETLVDTMRGPVNNGGLFGERAGWHLPLVDAGGWEKAKPTAAPPKPGTYWLRTRFALDLPRGHDVQLGLAFGDTTQPRSDRENRVLIFVNGWNMGQFIAHIGPQRTFVIPPGILNPNGENTIALAVTTDGKAANALEPVALVTLRAARGGVPLEMMEASASAQALEAGTRQ
ncbi:MULTISPECIES: beta-galactosidase [unclassified Massilia]|uniref:beta-galactosidase n=1 Tax=unclassified Massilia TaxID=2609279 RepID=UPI001E5B1FD5|nr:MULTISPECIES: beta-galactosidase [unclassified Massilia]